MQISANEQQIYAVLNAYRQILEYHDDADGSEEEARHIVQYFTEHLATEISSANGQIQNLDGNDREILEQIGKLK